MKKLLFILTIILFSFSSQAQGRLQFNQVVTIVKDTTLVTSAYGSSGFSYSHNFNIYTVPTNKVAKLIKIDNADIFTQSGNCDVNTFHFTLNSVNIDQNKLSGAWLKEGDLVSVDAYQEIGSSTYGSSCTQNNNLFLSIIEYNIIP